MAAGLDADARFSPVGAARRILRIATTGALATLAGKGAPFASLVAVSTTPEGEPILLLSELAVHTRNLHRDRRASLLLAPPDADGDPLAGARLTLTGSVTPADPDPQLRRRFLAHHEEAAAYADFADFGFRRFTVAAAHLVAGFGRIVDLPRERLLTDVATAGGLLTSEEEAITHMNADHGDALRLYATRLLGMPDGPWRMTGADPDGVDLRAGNMRARLSFPERVDDAAGLRVVLADLAARAREAGEG